MKINEVALRHKAGVIPYYIDQLSKQLKMLFMVPSNPAYGGTQWQIAKGGVDEGEDVQEAAVREGTEELGLIPSNISAIKKIATQVITGDDETYNLTVYAAMVKDPTDFTGTDHETGKRKWLTAEEFAQKGRQNHQAIVQLLNTQISSPKDRSQVS